MHAAEAARSDRLGKTQGPPKIEPLSDVLAKILQRKEAVVQRSVSILLEAASDSMTGLQRSYYQHDAL